MSEHPFLPAEGGCACTAVRYSLRARPLFVHCCHCTWCRRESGSAFALNAVIEATEVKCVRGEPTAHALPSASGNGQDVFRCSDCGTALWSHYRGAGDKFDFVRVGTLDDPSVAPPDIHIYTSTKLPWVLLPDDVPAVPEFYRRSQYWPAASLARFEALRKG